MDYLQDVNSDMAMTIESPGPDRLIVPGSSIDIANMVMCIVHHERLQTFHHFEITRLVKFPSRVFHVWFHSHHGTEI